jgi:succinate dehydrogenase / fumarate reductase, cytochrome b subunit
MSWFLNFYRSALGKKAVMALTGILLWGFVLAHMAGNLKFFLGPEALNHYGEWLRVVGDPLFPRGVLLWAARAGLILATLLHVHAALALTAMNRRARPQDYAAGTRSLRSSWAARTMRWSGAALLLFVAYHLMHFTFGNAHQDFREGDVYHNVGSAFRIGWVTLLYLVAMALLGMHLYHGLWSMFQSLGWNHPRFNRWRRAFAVAFTLIIALGFMVVPVAVAVGWVRPADVAVAQAR